MPTRSGSHLDCSPESRRGEDPRRTLGRLGEDVAAQHLAHLGYVALERNVRTRFGEIDLIACDGGVIVFVEVKTRRAPVQGRLGSEDRPLAWLRPRQRIRLRRLAAAWLGDRARTRPTAHTIRFDAIGVILDRADRLVSLEHLEGAW
jgi:putative endonuclease